MGRMLGMDFPSQHNNFFILLDLGQGGYRLIAVPAIIADHAKEYQKDFDQWLYSPNANHNYWIASPDGTKALSYDGAEAFVSWLNEYILKDIEHKAYIVPTLYF